MKKVGTNGEVGIWHETYIIKKGQYENIYANMPPFLLGKVGKLEKIISSNNSALFWVVKRAFDLFMDCELRYIARIGIGFVCNNCNAKCEPTKPVAPVIKII